MLLVGLGNPGTQYRYNRHNIGFMALDAIASDYRASSWTKKFKGEWAEISMSRLFDNAMIQKDLSASSNHPIIESSKLYLLKPLTFMNLSGESVQAAAAFYKIPLSEIIVFHDELDLEPGRLRVKLGGGAGGHNGLKSIDQQLGQDYQRVRIGIGHPGHKDLVTPYVLSDFAKDEIPVQQKMLEAISRELPSLIQGDAAGFMNKLALEFQV